MPRSNLTWRHVIFVCLSVFVLLLFTAYIIVVRSRRYVSYDQLSLTQQSQLREALGGLIPKNASINSAKINYVLSDLMVFCNYTCPYNDISELVASGGFVRQEFNTEDELGVWPDSAWRNAINKHRIEYYGRMDYGYVRIAYSHPYNSMSTVLVTSNVFIHPQARDAALELYLQKKW